MLLKDNLPKAVKNVRDVGRYLSIQRKRGLNSEMQFELVYLMYCDKYTPPVH